MARHWQCKKTGVIYAETSRISAAYGTHELITLNAVDNDAQTAQRSSPNICDDFYAIIPEEVDSNEQSTN